MRLALELAAQAKGRTRPNPMVGAVIVREGEILATGYHQKAGGPHGEIDALQKLGGKAEGATLYVNLEPCSHFGRTPPCVDRVIEAGIARVVIGTQDPNPRVNGQGIARLQGAGIAVTTGVLEGESRELNRAFFTYIQKKRPFVSLKVAMTLDAKIATATGESRWLSQKEARIWTHQIRDQVDAVVVGAGTVIADDPALTVRHLPGRDPKRFVLDSSLRSPLSAQIFQAPLAAGTTVFYVSAEESVVDAFRGQGVTVVALPADRKGRVDLSAVLGWLHREEILHLLVEGGGQIHGAFLEERLVDQLLCVVTPWLLGAEGRPAFGFRGAERLSENLRLRWRSLTSLGADLLLEAIPEWEEQGETLGRDTLAILKEPR